MEGLALQEFNRNRVMNRNIGLIIWNNAKTKGKRRRQRWNRIIVVAADWVVN